MTFDTFDVRGGGTPVVRMAESKAGATVSLVADRVLRAVSAAVRLQWPVLLFVLHAGLREPVVQRVTLGLLGRLLGDRRLPRAHRADPRPAPGGWSRIDARHVPPRPPRRRPGPVATLAPQRM
ncbi:hypothetical protein [Streptomyces sp. CB03234]|uniref:hypothetical protein n=1 Tax=Streptomyces sp. (strain CB03234) TaxID=1703937 RepID=UPI00117C57E7|nr:hypothetical protein [Streptomyces sp. CB03234]